MIKGDQQEIWKQSWEDHEFRVNLSFVRHCTTDTRNHSLKSSRKVLWLSKPVCGNKCRLSEQRDTLSPSNSDAGWTP